MKKLRIYINTAYFKSTYQESKTQQWEWGQNVQEKHNIFFYSHVQ